MRSPVRIRAGRIILGLKPTVATRPRKTATVTPLPTPEKPPRKPISWAAAGRFSAPKTPVERGQSFHKPTYAPGVLGHNSGIAQDHGMAMDAFPDQVNQAWGWASGSYHGQYAEGIGFFGYPILAELSQRSEYRQACEVTAEEMTRKWITIKANGDKDKTDKINQLTDAMIKFRLREAFRDAMEYDCVFGLSAIYPDLMLGDLPVSEDQDELLTRLTIDKSKIAKGSLRGFRVLDPTWVAPTDYNTLNPMDPEFYKPRIWFVMGKRIHTSRLLIICSRPVPDLLKPAYNFGGVSLIQEMKPYVDNWLKTRQAVTDLVQAFTIWHLSTDMQALIQGGGSGADMDERLALFTLMKNNRGIMATDKTEEDLSNISVPLGSLEKLQAQAQEHMAAVARIPLVKLLGITPQGLNTSSADEIRTFYDSIHGQQEKVFGLPLKRALDILQLNEWGEIDEDIVYEFNQLWELDEAGEAAVRKTDADTDLIYISAGVISPEEVRTKLAGDSGSQYPGLEGPAPEPLMLDEDSGEQNQPAGKAAPASNAAQPNKRDITDTIAKKGAEGTNTGANSGV